MAILTQIDLWLVSPSCIQFISESSHDFAPLSDHKMIKIHLTGTKQEQRKLRGFWKLNNDLLNDDIFCDTVKISAEQIFRDKNMNHIQKWEYFKFKLREAEMRQGKEIKNINVSKEINVMNELNTLMKKDNLSEDNEIKLKRLKEEIDDAYINMAKGAFIRSKAKWLELGERNSSYFFALEKRNQKRNNISALKINDTITTNHLEISNYVGSFYSNICKSNSHINDFDRFIESIKEHFKTNCERPITKFSTSMKQGMLTLIPKPDKDHLCGGKVI